MDKHFNESIEFLKQLLKIKSVYSTPLKDMPFGQGVYDALNFTLNKAKSLGFETINYQNYVGEVIFGKGNDEDGLAILCHLDVVPEGDESLWTYPPYSGTEVDGKIYSRGVIDNKGPTAICLYALKQLKDEGFIPNRKIKLILGCNEESGFLCMKHYNKVAKAPIEGFVPDGHFPVIYAEKGILNYTLKAKKDKRLLKVSGGSAINIVCDFVECEIDNLTDFEIETAKKYNLKVEGNKVYSYGKNAHASTPDEGENALDKMTKFLGEVNLISTDVHNGLFKDCYKLKQLNDHSGYLTMSPDIVKSDDDYIYIEVDVRYPVSVDAKYLINTINKLGIVEINVNKAPHYVDKDSDIIKKLLKCYREVTGDYSEPIAMGGGTYAKTLKQGVAYGPIYSQGTGAHIVNEFEEIKDFKTTYEIYYKAIKKLCSN